LVTFGAAGIAGGSFTPQREVPMSVLLKPKEVARRLDVSPHTLLEWRRDGFGPPFMRLRGNDLRYPEDELETWIHDRTANSLTEERARGDRLNGAAETGGFR